jgi:hypothetical protein
MALYVSAGRRRRVTYLVGGAALVLGLLLGVAIGRSTVPSLEDRIRDVRADARRTAAGLRVIALHDEEGAASPTTGDAGADLVLRRTRVELIDELDGAPWVSAQEGRALLRAVDDLQARRDRAASAFGTAADAVADRIIATFG